MFVALTISQLLIAGGFLFMGVLHFAVPKPFIAIMPRFIPQSWWKPLVLVSGVFEALGGAGILLPITRPWAGIGLLALLVAVFPANVQMLLTARRKNAPALQQAILWIRLPLQPAAMWWVWWATLGAGAVA